MIAAQILAERFQADLAAVQAKVATLTRKPRVLFILSLRSRGGSSSCRLQWRGQVKRRPDWPDLATLQQQCGKV